MFDAEARNHELEQMPEHARRYARAKEFVEVVLRLWDSWADDALRYDRAGSYADPGRVRPVNHRGEHFLVDGSLNVPGPPQGHPVLFQAGASGRAGSWPPAGRRPFTPSPMTCPAPASTTWKSRPGAAGPAATQTLCRSCRD